MKIIRGFLLAITISFVFSCLALADGVSIDKVYNPYVQLLETEVEYRALLEQDTDKIFDGRQRHILGVGKSLSDKLMGEFYLIGSATDNESVSVDAIELELKWQLTEQGEFNNDWGVLFELENRFSESVWEASSSLIALHEWPKWVLTGNLSLIYEWGSDIENEWETAFASQLRYRRSQSLEPAIEFYAGQDTRGIGPVLTGQLRFKDAKKLRWEFGVILDVNSDAASENWKLNFEYEF